MRLAIACLALLFSWTVQAQQDATRTLATFADLRASTVTDSTKTVIVMSGTNFNDGWGGIFHWAATDTAAEDGTNIIRSTRTSSGRWDRITLFVVTGGSSVAPNAPVVSILTTNSILGGGTTAADVGPLKLRGDVQTPGVNKQYRTDGTGAPGWYDFPTGGGLGDVVAAANNNMTGNNTNNGSTVFIGPLVRKPSTGTTNLNWTTMNLATYASPSDFAVQFSGSFVAGSQMEYWVTNTASTNINIVFPEVYSIGNGQPETTVEVTANSVAIIYIAYEGSKFFLQSVTKNDATLVALSTSGYYFSAGETKDGSALVLTNLILAPGYASRVSAWFWASAKTNTSTIEVSKTALFRNDGGTLTRVGTYTNSVIKSADASAWDADIVASGTNIALQVTGDALNPVNWAVHGFARAYTNAPTVCSVTTDAMYGSVSENVFPNDTYYWLAAKFISTNADAYVACGADLKLAKAGAPNGNLTVEIWTWDGVNDKPGTIVGTGSSGVPATSLPGAADWVAFADIHASITPGNAYAVVLKSSATDDGTNHITWSYFFTGAPKAVASNDNGGGWASVNDSGPFEFKLRSN